MMYTINFTDKLLATPLFQGLSKSDLNEIVGNTKFSFSKYEAGKTIVRAESYCNDLMFLLNGSVEVSTDAADHSFTFTEILNAPLQVQPQRMFGLNQNYTSTYKAYTRCNFMRLSKTEVMKLYTNYEVFRINLINLFATAIHRYEHKVWALPGKTLRDRIISFMVVHSIHPAGEKKIKIKMTTLAHELNESRLNISIELNKLQDDGLISLSRGMIIVPALELLRQ